MKGISRGLLTDAENDVGSPSDVVKGNWDTELVDEESGRSEQVGEGHSLGAHLEGEDFDWVESLHWSPSERVEALEDVNPGEDSGGDWLWNRSNVLVGRALLDVGDGAGDGDADPAERAGKVDADEHWATAEAVNHGGAGSGEDDLDGVHADLDVGLFDVTDDTGSIQELGEIVGDDSVTSPLAKKGDDAVASKTVAGSSVDEQGSVIPPSLVGTVHLQVRLVLRHLELDPSVLDGALTVVLGKNGLGAIWLAMDVEPSGRLGEEPGAENDDHWEHHLKTDWDRPGSRGSLVGETSASGAGCDEGTDWPHDVVETSGHSAVSWVRDLNDVTWSSCTENTDTKTEEEATTHKLSNRIGTCKCAGDLNNNTENDNSSRAEHSSTSSPGIDSWADERNGGDGTDLVHGGDDTSPGTGVGNVEEGLEVLVGEESTEEGTIVTVGGRTAESNGAAEVEAERCLGEWSWRVLNHGGLESLITENNLHLSNLGFLVELIFESV